MNDITQGSTFCNENYNGHDLGYLCVRYLKETLSLNELSDLMKDFNKIKKIGKTILEDALHYYFKEVK